MIFVLADKQDITRTGLKSLCRHIPDVEIKEVENKNLLISVLQQLDEAVVVLDYSLFDFEDVSSLIVTSQRFQNVHWILFSDDLTDELVQRATGESTSFSAVSKHSDVAEIEEALRLSVRHERYICRLAMEQLLTVNQRAGKMKVELTKTEIEILKEIALGKTTKEIAAARCSSFHTINTHRKNIFRKLDVNTAYEATKYALRAGIIDSSDYYI
jgi:DNA-binding NarL/FixJ family response regulator